MDLIPEWVVINDETKKHVNTTSHQRDAGAYHHIPELGIFLGGATKRCHTAVAYKRGILEEPYLVGGFNSSEKY